MKSKEEHLEELYEVLDLPVISKTEKEEEVMMPMRDGAKLKTQYWLPDTKAPWPAIVVRCCYPDQVGQLKVKAAWCNRYGFAFIVQWCRGIFGSEGEWEPNVHERDDGLDLMDALQNDDRIGDIGYWGDSYLALTGWAMADAVPEKVRTMYLGVYGCDRHTSAYQDGLFRQDILTAWAMGNAGRKVEADYITSAMYRPQAEVDEALWDGRLDWYRDWITHPDRKDSYWQEGFWGMLRAIPGKVKIPVFVREGWYDHHLGSALVTWDLLNDETKQHSVLEIGPWRHNYNVALTHQDTSRLEDNRVSSPMRWFYDILVQKKMPQGEIRKYVIGEDRWKVTKIGEREEKTTKVFYLAPDHLLGEEGVTESSCESYYYDPNDPVRTHGAESLFQSRSEVGSLEQEKPFTRKDILTWESDPLEADLAIDGEVSVQLFVSSDCSDTAFSAKLSEVFSDGTAVNIRSSITTLAYRGHADERMAYEPGTVVKAGIDMWKVCWTLKKGSRLRLDISSSDFPQYSVHANMPGIWSLQKETRIAKQKVWMGEEHASRVLLPVRI